MRMKRSAGIILLDVKAREPAVFIPSQENGLPVFRGSCILKVKGYLRIKRLTVRFNGISRIQWPQGEDNTVVFHNLFELLLTMRRSSGDKYCYRLCNSDTRFRRMESGEDFRPCSDRESPSLRQIDI